VFDAHEVVVEDHLGDRYAYLLGELFDRIGFEDGLFTRADSPLPILAGGGLHAGPRARRHCWRVFLFLFNHTVFKLYSL
jgi:hypothetical protein